MRVEVIRDENPLSLRVCRDRLSDMIDKIFFRSGLAHGGANDLTGGHFQVGDQGLGPVADVLELTSFYLSRFHRLGRMLALQGLDAGHLVETHGVRALLMQLRGLVITLADALHLLGECLGVLRIAIEPVAAEVGFEFGGILKNALPGAARSTPRCLV